MKIKTVKIIFLIFLAAGGVFFFVVLPILINFFWWTIVVCLSICFISMYLFFFNSPHTSLHRFYDYEEKKVKRHIIKVRFRYRKQNYEFSCGQTVMQMKLEKYGIYMTQDEIIAISGDKNFGTSPWEIERGLNSIFLVHGKHLRARIQFYTSYSQIIEHLVQERGVIVLFMSHFMQKGFSSTATYPHFALLNYINLAENKVTLVVPSSDYVQHKMNGPEEGESILSIEEFHRRFYVDRKYLKRLEYKPTKTRNSLVNLWNRGINLLFRAAFVLAYYLKILKPGIAIFVEPVEKK